MKELTLKQLIVKIKRRKKIIASSASGEMADILLKSSPEVKELTTRLNKGKITKQEFQEIISGITPEDLDDKPVKMRLENVEMIKIKGDKGDKGDTGFTPVKGKDYFDGKDGYTPVKNKDYFDGKDGKDGRDGLGITGLKGDKGDKPKHKWEGTILTFENPDGTWGEGVELGVKVKEKGSSRRYTPAIIGGLNPAQVDARIRNIGLGNIVTRDHDLLTGLGDDDHTIYALLAGRSGGQTIIGGTGTTDDLTFKTTSGIGATGADMHFLVGNNGATEAVTILNSGNVGIGTAGPTQKLEISGSVKIISPTTSGIDITQTTNSPGIDITDSGNDDSIRISKSGTQAAGYGALKIVNTGTGFGLRVDDGASDTSPFIIDTNGNVGIGTTTPDALLNIEASAIGTGVVHFKNTVSNDDAAAMKLKIETGGAGGGDPFLEWRTTRSWTMGIDNSDSDKLIISKISDLSDQVFTIDTTGNVGIGTAAPTNLLSLGGNAARTFWTERGTVANTAGYNLTVRVGGATAASTDKNGGQLILAGGISTGTGTSSVLLQTCPAGSTGTADNTLGTMLEITGNKFSVFGVTAVVRATALTAANASALNTGDATSDTVIANMRTRIGELETKLTAYGLLT